jgi:hypothetical protein
MAVSLGFGVLFATVIILLLVPALYMIVEDLRVAFGAPDERAPSPGGWIPQEDRGNAPEPQEDEPGWAAMEAQPA